jgi:hypothetical protein
MPLDNQVRSLRGKQLVALALPSANLPHVRHDVAAHRVAATRRISGLIGLGIRDGTGLAFYVAMPGENFHTLLDSFRSLRR